MNGKSSFVPLNKQLSDGSEYTKNGNTENSSSQTLIRTLGEIWSDSATWKAVEKNATGIPMLDKVLGGGFQVGAINLIAGKPGKGKTHLAAQLANNAAQHGTSVGFISLEQTKEQVARQIMSQISNVPRTSIDDGRLNIADQQMKADLDNTQENHKDMPLGIVDKSGFPGGFTHDDLRTVVANGVKQHGWKLIVLDHIGELVPTEAESGVEQLRLDRFNASALLDTAQQNKVAMVAVTSLRKSSSSRGAGECDYRLEDVMGAAEFGYVASVCVAIEGVSMTSSKESKMLLRVLKNRYGVTPPDVIELSWLPECGRI